MSPSLQVSSAGNSSPELMLCVGPRPALIPPTGYASAGTHPIQQHGTHVTPAVVAVAHTGSAVPRTAHGGPLDNGAQLAGGVH